MEKGIDKPENIDLENLENINNKRRRVITWLEVEDLLPADWALALSTEVSKDYFLEIKRKLHAKTAVIYPPIAEVFGFTRCSLNNVKIVILGQDPYHAPDQGTIDV